MARRMKTCYWHGNDATIIGGNKREGYVLLVGSFTDDEARKVKKLLEKEDPQLEKYGEQIVFAEPDEWEQQQL